MPDLERALRPWQRVSGAISALQTPLMAATVALLVFDASRAWAYVGAGVVTVLEAAEWLVVRQAIRRLPSFRLQDLHDVPSLDRRSRRSITSMFVVCPLIVPALAWTAAAPTWKDGLIVAAVAWVAVAPGFISLYRVRRLDTWMAVAPIYAERLRLDRKEAGSA